MRRVGSGLVAAAVALAAAGCAARPEVISGRAAPLTAPAGPARTPDGPATPTATTPAPTTPSPTPSPTPTAPPAPTAYRPVTLTGFGVTVRLPLPADWTRTASSPPGFRRVDVTVPGSPQLLLLRVDLTARLPGTLADAVAAQEKRTRADYRRVSVVDVPGVGEDAVDWTFTWTADGVPSRSADRLLVVAKAGVAVLLRAPDALWERYLPVWRTAVDGLDVTPG